MTSRDFDGPVMDIYRAHGVRVYGKHTNTRGYWRKMRAQTLRDQCYYIVAVDDAGGNLVVGCAAYQKEWMPLRGGETVVTISEVLVLPEYAQTNAREMLVRHIVRASIACEAQSIRVACHPDDEALYVGELFSRPKERVFLERPLPWARYKKKVSGG